MTRTDLTASLVAQALTAPLLGDDRPVTGLAPVSTAGDGDLTFVMDPVKYAAALEAALSAGAIVLAPASATVAEESRGVLIAVDSPRAAFAISVDRFFARKPEPGVAATARVDPTATVHPTASVGEYTVIRAGAVIGEGAEIRDHVVIGYDAVVGDHCLVKSHAVVGEEGFGMERDAGGDYLRLPHVGSVVLADHVEVGNFVTVCAGTIAPTRIGDHTKIDDHAHIAHNCQIGRNVIITAAATLSGSVTVEDDTWIGPNASVIQGVTLGRDSILGIGAVAVRSVPVNEVRTGNPARRLSDNRPAPSAS